MPKILEPKIQASGLMDALAIGLAKTFIEETMTPIVGNATLKSGAVKLVSGSAISSMIAGKAGKIIGSAMTIDGVEDIVHAMVGKALPAFGSEQNAIPGEVI